MYGLKNYLFRYALYLSLIFIGISGTSFGDSDKGDKGGKGDRGGDHRDGGGDRRGGRDRGDRDGGWWGGRHHRDGDRDWKRHHYRDRDYYYYYNPFRFYYRDSGNCSYDRWGRLVCWDPYTGRTYYN